MKTFKPIFSNVARLREMGNELILNKLAQAGLSNVAPSHGDVLVYLLKVRSCRMTDLAKAVGRSKSTLTTLVEKLEREKLLVREADSEDSRAVIVQLTEKGLQLQPAFESISKDLESFLTARLSEEEVQTLDRLLRKAVDR